MPLKVAFQFFYRFCSNFLSGVCLQILTCFKFRLRYPFRRHTCLFNQIFTRTIVLFGPSILYTLDDLSLVSSFCLQISIIAFYLDILKIRFQGHRYFFQFYSNFFRKNKLYAAEFLQLNHNYFLAR